MNVATTLLDVAGRHDTGEALVFGPVRLDYAAVVWTDAVPVDDRPG